MMFNQADHRIIKETKKALKSAHVLYYLALCLTLILISVNMFR